MAMADQDKAVAVHGLCHWYGEGSLRKQVLFDVALDVARGELVFLMGPSGCGKTTVLTLVGALRSVEQGSVTVLGRELAGASEAGRVASRRRTGFIFQNHNLHRSLTALENVRMGLEALGQAMPRDADAQCRAMLMRVGMEDHAHKLPNQLSGGQKQRVAIARALVGEPALVLADEPTAALDGKTGRDVIELLRNLATERGLSVLMVTHDNRILDFADRIIAMEDGRLITAENSVQGGEAAPWAAADPVHTNGLWNSHGSAASQSSSSESRRHAVKLTMPTR
jgi:putative ABC transport system ATP-binding protein